MDVGTGSGGSIRRHRGRDGVVAVAARRGDDPDRHAAAGRPAPSTGRRSRVASPDRPPPGRGAHSDPRPRTAIPRRDLARERLGPAAGGVVPVGHEIGEQRAPPRPCGRRGRRRAGSRRRARSAGSSRTAAGRPRPRSSPGGPRASRRPSPRWRLVMTVRIPVTIPPTTTRCPSSASSLRSPE